MIRAIFILLLTCASSIGLAQVGIITTIAGTGEIGYSGDNGPATAAKLNNPNALLFDQFHNLIFCDDGNHVVRKINHFTGIITTIAGTGIPGYNGDNIPATDAQLQVPEGICSDTEGNIYIADAANGRIRKISASTGIITTIAGDGAIGDLADGNSALDAEFNGLAGMCCYGDNLYVCDYNNSKVRKINFTTGIITRIAGNGTVGYSGDNGPATQAQLNGAIDVLCDNAGNIFIADQDNGAIRRVDILTGKITTFAGTGTVGYSGDNGPATAAQMNEDASLFIDKDNNMFVAEYLSGAIRKIDLTTGIITTVAGGSPGYGGDGGPATNAKLNCTDAIVDDGGNIYIADYINNRIRKVNGALKVNNYQFNEFALSVTPNPTAGKFEILCPTNEGVITVCDMAGRIVYQSATFAAKTEMDISDQPKGMYMVYVQSGEDRYVSKILLNK